MERPPLARISPSTPQTRRRLLQGAGIATLGLAGSGALVLGQDATPAAQGTPAGMPATPASTPEPPFITLDQLEEQARLVMTPQGYAYVAGGVGDEWTLGENRRAFDDFPLAARRLAGIAETDIDLSATILDVTLPFPIIVPPMGAQAFGRPEADVLTAAGTAAAGTLFTASTASNRSIEDMAAASTGPKWFQLYYNTDLDVTRSLLERAASAGYGAIVFTVDSLGPGDSVGYLTYGSPTPDGATYANFDPAQGGSGSLMDRKVAFVPEDIGFVAETSGLPVIVKGILRPDDAVAAIDAGAAGIQVSNHGGRVFDGVPATITLLEEIVDAVAGRVPVIVDGGIRSGADVVRALALGADAVAVGRPVFYGLAVGGAEGVRGVLDFLHEDLLTAMLSVGAARIADLDKSYLVTPAGS